MDYIVVDNTEWTYPDRDFSSYLSGSGRLTGATARNSIIGAQILFRNLPKDGRLDVALEGLEGEVYGLYPVYVEDNPFLTKENALEHFPERWAPYLIYDCIKPFDGAVEVTGGVGGLYISLTVGRDAKPGKLTGAVRVQDTRIPVELTVYDVTVPDETRMRIINGYSRAHVASYHHVEPGSEAFWQLDTQYLKMLRRMHQNMLYAPGAEVTELGDNRYSFTFKELEAFMEKALGLGFQYFNLASVGGRKSWKESTILVHGMPAMSYEAYRYLAQYLPALEGFLDEKGWLDRCYMGVSDEPNAENATEFRALCGLVRKLAPHIRLIDAMSYGNLHGALDVWVPLNSEYQEHRTEIETFREGGDEIWHYVCCGPRKDGYINRFMDLPLLATRYLFWGNYKYDLKGYLHWASNHYQPGQDPFKQNCPIHHNADSVTTLPSGDTHLIYPGADGPWMSMRLEAQRESAEDYELLKLLEEKDKTAADAVCNSVFTSFNQVDYDPNHFKAARERLLKALS